MPWKGSQHLWGHSHRWWELRSRRGWFSRPVLGGGAGKGPEAGVRQAVLGQCQEPEGGGKRLLHFSKLRSVWGRRCLERPPGSCPRSPCHLEPDRRLRSSRPI